MLVTYDMRYFHRQRGNQFRDKRMRKMWWLPLCCILSHIIFKSDSKSQTVAFMIHLSHIHSTMKGLDQRSPKRLYVISKIFTGVSIDILFLNLSTGLHILRIRVYVRYA